MTLAERMAEWPKQWHREGVVQGRRTVLRHLAARRFGDAVGDELDALLGDTDDWDRLAAVSDLIVTADVGADLIDGAAGILRPND